MWLACTARLRKLAKENLVQSELLNFNVEYYPNNHITINIINYGHRVNYIIFK